VIPPDALRSLRHRDYRIYFFGQLVSMIGTWMQTTAQSWLVYRLTGSGTLLGLVAAAGQAPSLFLGLAGGAAADRYNRRTLLIVTQSLALAQAALLAWLTSTGRIQVWHVFALAAGLGVVNVFDMPARQAMVPSLVPREDMSNAIALSGILLNSSRLIGPAVAGILIARSGEAACFWLNAVSYIAVVVSLFFIGSRAVEARDAAEGELERILSGLRYSFEDPERRSILLLLAAVSLAAVPAMMLLPVYSEGVLHAGPRGFGFLTTAFAVGALLASARLAQRARPEEMPLLIGRAAGAFGAAVAMLSLLRGFYPACLAMIAAGWGMMTCFSGGNIRLQDRSSDAMRGRVMGLFSMTFMATAPFGMLAMGWASDRFGAPAALAAGGLLCVACGFIFWSTRPRLGRPTAALAAALVFCATGFARAATPQVLTWEDCVKAALDANPDLAAARFTLEATRASFYSSFNAFMPQVSLSNSVSESNLLPSNAWSAQAAASMRLFDVGQIAAIRSAAAAVSLDEANLRKASADLRSSLRQAFSHALFAQESLKAAQNVLEIRERDSEMLTLRYDSGSESKGNMLRAKAQALQARLALDAAHRDLRTAQRELSQRLGREEFADYVSSGALGAVPPPARPDDLRSLLPLRPDILLAEATERRFRAALLSSEGVLWPSLSANYVRGRGDRVEFPSARYSWSAGATLSYPLFAGGPTSAWYNTMAGRRGLDAARRSLDSARVAGLSALESAWAAYANAVDQVRVQTDLLAAARQRNDEADVKYASGLLSFDNWEVIVSDRVSNENQYVSALRAAMDAETAWNRALGRALGE
jgi:outer membrane protein TolC/predicted MFS family arabinose efflux permease